MSTRSLIESLNEISSEKTRQENEGIGDEPIFNGRRPATYDDYLKAQRSVSFKKRKKQVSFGDAHEVSAELRPTFSPPAEESPSAEFERDLKNTAKVLKRMSHTGRGSIQDANALNSMVHELQVQLKKLNADGIFKEKSLKIPWYAPPLQRQRWEDESTLPIVNHGTLFFDLFFVGGIYNICEMITSGVSADSEDDGSEDTLRIIIYLLGIFGPLFSTWENGVYYQSRYLVADYAHQVFELLRFFGVAAIVLFIRPIQMLRDPQGFASVFALILSFLCEALMQLVLDLEVYFRAQGDREAIQNHTLAEMKKGIIPATVTYATSTIIAAVLRFGPFDEPLNNGALWNVADLPLTLTAAGYLWNLFMQIKGSFHKPKGTADIRKTLVPYNIDFVIERYSDWFLLLLGEAVMAMVETTENQRDYVVTFVETLILIVLFTLKFESEPENVHGHALWRNERNAYAFRVLTEVLSIGIIILSVTFKIIEDETRFGISEHHCTIALTVSLGWVLIALELTLLTHKGLDKSWERLFRPKEDDTTVSIYWPLAGITMFKVVLFIFLFAIPAWQDSVTIANALVLFVVLLVAITRIIGWAFVFKEDEIKEMANKAKTIFKSVRSSVDTFGDDSNRLSAVEEETGSNAGSHTSGGNRRRQESETYHGMFDAVIFADFEGSIVNVNHVAVTMFRYEAKSEMIGKNISTLVGGTHAKHHDNYMKKFRDRGATLLFGKQRKLKARRKTGEEFACILGIQLAGNGKHVIGFIRDMEEFEDDGSEILTPDSETKTQKQLKRVLDDNSSDSIAVIDLDGSIIGVNRTFVEEFRYDNKEEVLGLDISIIMDVKYHKMHHRMMAKCRKSKEMGGVINSRVLGKQNLLPAKRKDGSEFKCIIGVNPIEDSDFMVGYIKKFDTLLPRTAVSHREENKDV